MHCDVRQIVIVQARSAQLFFTQIKTQGFNQMQVGPRSGTHSDGVSGVRGDHRVLKNHVQ